MTSDGPLRIAFVTPELPPQRWGGIGRYTEDMARAFSRMGHDVTVIGWRIRAEARTRESWGAIESVNWEFPGMWRFSGRVDPLGAFRAAIAVRQFFRRAHRAFDVVEASNWRGDAWLAGALSCPLVVRASTPWWDCVGRTPDYYDRWIAMAERRLAAKADVVVAHSSAMAEKVRDRYGRTADAVIHLGMDPGEQPPTYDDPTIDMLVVGRAELRKGTDLVLQSLAEVLPADPRVTVTFVGAALDDYVRTMPELGSALERIRATGRCSELGFVDEATKLEAFHRADWLVMPSRFESFGLVAVEAMRTGTPVVVSDGNGLREVGEVTDTTVFVQAGSLASLTEGVRNAVDRGPGHKRRVAQAVRAAFLANFSIDRVAEHTESLYRSAISRRRV